MKKVSKRLKIWLILSPIIIISFIIAIAYVFISSYQSDLYVRLEKTSNDTTLKLVKSQLERKINIVQDEDKIIFDGDNPYLNDKRLINYFKTSLNQPTDYTYIFKVDKKNGNLKVMYSSSINIKAGEYLGKNKRLLFDVYTLSKLYETNQYFSQSYHDSTKTLYKLFKYFPKSNLIICIGTTREQHKLMYAKYIKSVTNDLNETKSNAIFIELALSLVGAFLISWIIKRAITNFENTENELKKSNKALKEQLLIDSLTELPNKNSLISAINNMDMPKLILIDIDDFRKMNEYYKQETVRDVVLCMKKILFDYIEENDEYNFSLYHIDTNQFALLENSPFDMEKYEIIANELSKKLKGVRINSNDPISYAEFNCTIGFSLEEKNVYETAVIALRRAKEKGRDYICYFKVLGEEDEYKKQIQGADFIKKALESDRVVPFFQPIYDKNKNILKYECLVRIIDENGKIVSPYMFLNTSKRIKRYSQIEKALIKKSLEAIEGTDKTVSINLATRDMIDTDVKHYVIEEIVKRGLAKQIIFEIVEDESIKSLDRVSLFINKAKAMGIRIAIDDFGSGYSNFSYMLSLKPDYVKIDGTLIKDLEHDTVSHAIVSSIILFTKRLGIKTIAEFVHNEKVFEICKELGIDEFQGFYLSEPNPKFL